MAIEIIKNGKLPIIQKACYRCGCEFRFDLCEIDDARSRIFSEYVVNCPYCGADIKLSRQDEVDLGVTSINTLYG